MVVKRNGINKTIYLPNAVGGVFGYMDEGTRFDIKRSDGWELVYNWIPTNGTDEVLFPEILLYNKFRGTLKLFYYHLNENLTTGGNVIAALGIANKTTKLFNNNPNSTKPEESSYFNSVTQSTAIGVTSEYVGLSPDKWYAFEWDISYLDNDIIPGNYFSFLGTGMDLSSISLNGNITGNITGKLVNSSVSPNGTSLYSNTDIKTALRTGTSKIVAGFYKRKYFFKIWDIGK